MKLAACYNTWGDWELLYKSVENILPLVDQVFIVPQYQSNYGEIDAHIDLDEEMKKFTTYFKSTQGSPIDFLHGTWKRGDGSAMIAETAKRNLGLMYSRDVGFTHYISMDADEFYDPEEFLREKQRFIDNPNLQGLVCASRVYFGSPELTIGLDTTLVPFIHKITPTLKHEFNRNYPFAWEGKSIRIDPTRSFNINSGVEMSPIIMEHYSWVRKDMEAYKRKIRNSTARHHLERSNILQDLVNAKEGYFCEFYQKRLVRVPNRFNIPYGELSGKDLQSVAAADPSSQPDV